MKNVQERGLQLRGGDQPEDVGAGSLPPRLRSVGCELELGF
jgi:hypothetical protein